MIVALGLAFSIAFQDSSELPSIRPVVTTESVAHDPDDPAVWLHPKDPAKSLVYATDKFEVSGGLYAFGLDGKIRFKVTGLDRPNNVDVQAGFPFLDGTGTVLVATERGARRLRIWRVHEDDGSLSDVTGDTRVFTKREGDGRFPMGIGLYRSGRDVMAVVSPKAGPTEGYLAMYRLLESGGKVNAEEVRAFGEFSGEGEIEALVVDDNQNVVYSSDELFGIRQHSLNTDSQGSSEVFAKAGYKGDREGLAMLRFDGEQYLVSTEQTTQSILHIIRISDRATVLMVRTGSNETDGIDIIQESLGPRFPEGLLVMMNSSGRNFHFYNLRDLKRCIRDSIGTPLSSVRR